MEKLPYAKKQINNLIGMVILFFRQPANLNLMTLFLM